MSILGSIASWLSLDGDDALDEMKTVPNRSDYRRARTRRSGHRPVTHQAHTRRSPRTVPHEVFGGWDPRTAQQVAADEQATAKVFAAWERTQEANAELPEEERTAWVQPVDEQASRDELAARRRGRQARRDAQRARRRAA